MSMDIPPVTFWHSLGGPPGQVLEKIVDRYNQEHPERAQVDLRAIEQQGYEKAASDALQSARPARPNLILVPEFYTPQLMKAEQQGDVIPVADLLDETQVEGIAEIVKKTFGSFSLPLNPACGVLYINTQALEAIGYAPNWQPASMEELKDACQLMINGRHVDHGWTCAWPEAYLVETVLTQMDKTLVEPANGAEGHGAYKLSQLTDHILELWRQKQENIFLPPEKGNYDPTRIPFTSGKVGFYMQGSGHAGRISTESDFTVGCGALPTLSVNFEGEKHVFPLGGAAVWALKTAEDRAYAPGSQQREMMIKGVRDFLGYLASEEVQAYWHQETGYVPVSINVVTRLEGEHFYETHPVHKAVVDQTLRAKVGEHSFGIKMPNYSDARKSLYPLIYELLHFEGSEENARAFIEKSLCEFDERWSINQEAVPLSRPSE